MTLATIRRTPAPVIVVAACVPLSADYRQFLRSYGAGMAGPYPIFGLRPVEIMGRRWSVVESTEEYRAKRYPGVDGWAIISDHASNPVGLDRHGVIWIFDHDFGGVAELAVDFNEYLCVHCLGLTEKGHPNEWT